MLRRSALSAALSAALACVLATGAVAQTSPPAAAPAAPPVRVRGTATAVTADMLTVAARDGSTVMVKLVPPVAVVALQKVAPEDIKPGAFLAIVSKPGTDDLEAQSVTYFPPGGQKPREVQFPWDLPNTTMTNAAVTGVVGNGSTATGKGQELNLAFLGRTGKLTIPPGTPIVTQIPAESSDLKPGVPVFIFATKAADGSLSASRILVGKNGVNPTS